MAAISPQSRQERKVKNDLFTTENTESIFCIVHSNRTTANVKMTIEAALAAPAKSKSLCSLCLCGENKKGRLAAAFCIIR
jgi:hypothetical protein